MTSLSSCKTRKTAKRNFPNCSRPAAQAQTSGPNEKKEDALHKFEKSASLRGKKLNEK